MIICGCCIIAIIVSILIHSYYIKPTESSNKVLNNQKYNKVLLKYNQLATVVFFAIVSYIPILLPIEAWIDLDWYIIHQVPHQVLLGLVSPILLYVFNDEMRTYYVREMHEKAPVWIQNLKRNEVVKTRDSLVHPQPQLHV